MTSIPLHVPGYWEPRHFYGEMQSARLASYIAYTEKVRRRYSGLIAAGFDDPSPDLKGYEHSLKVEGHISTEREE